MTVRVLAFLLSLFVFQKRSVDQKKRADAKPSTKNVLCDKIPIVLVKLYEMDEIVTGYHVHRKT